MTENKKLTKPPMMAHFTRIRLLDDDEVDSI
jgi:hypothetical protein